MSVLVPSLSSLFFLAAIVWPLLRLWLRSGTFGVAMPRTLRPVEGVVQALLAASVGGFVAVASAAPNVPGLALAAPVAVTAVGVVVALLGLAIVVAAQSQMGASWRIGIGDESTALVERGLYRWSRNPIYAGVLVWVVGMLLVAPSWPGALLAAVVLAVVEVQARLEERHLVALHGEKYLAYCGRVGRFFPRIGRP